MKELTRRHFEIRVSYQSDTRNFDVTAIDVVMADNLVSLLAQFMILIGTLHKRVLSEETERIVDDDIPF